MERPAQAHLFRRMAQPSFYPHAPTAVAVADTHISRVFLTGPYAYKVKKATALPFLDFRHLAERRRCCHAEVTLNRRLAPGTYLGVVAIHGGPRGPTLAAAGPVVEYAVKMRQLNPVHSLSHRLRHTLTGPEEMDRLARCLADFHAQAARGAAVTSRGGWERIGAHCRDNFRDVAGAPSPLGAADACRPLSEDARFQVVAAVSRAFWRRHESRFRRREVQSRICEGHGDLRCEHVYLEDRVEIIDCIEFDPSLRCGDVAADLGFLLMDMDRHGAERLARHLLRAYAARAEDPGIYAVIDFYKCYRAMVRVKVNCLQLAAGGLGLHAARRLERATAGLLEGAYAYARRLDRPILFATCGLPASGKSHLARRLADTLDLPVYRSDRVRKRLAGVAPTESQVSDFETGIYRPAVTARTYARLLQLAHRRLRRGHSLVVDAAYPRRRQRRGLVELARQTRSGLVVIHCNSPRRVLTERLERRRRGRQISDARSGHLDPIAARFEPLDDLPAEVVIPLATDGDPNPNLLAVLAHAHARPWRRALAASVS